MSQFNISQFNISQFKMKTIAFAALATVACANAFAADVLIYNGNYPDVDTLLASRQIAAGNTPTTISWSGNSIAPLPASLSGYSQIWDINGNTAMSAPQQTAYLGYLAGGGALFLMGENTGYAANRNPSLISFIQAAGGGTVTITGNSTTSQTVSSALQTPNAVAPINYAGAGAYDSPGTGICLTEDGSNKCSAIAFNVGTLANAMRGSLISVLDINFLLSASAASTQGFIDNLIAYLAAQAVLGSGGTPPPGNDSPPPSAGFVPHSNNQSLGAATVLDQQTVASTINVNMALAIGQLAAMPAATQSAALQRLTPQTGQAQSIAATQVVSGALDTVQMRLEGIRGTDGPVIGMADRLQDGKVQLAANGDTSGLFTEATKRYGMWTKVFGSHGSQDMQDGYAGYHANSWGVAYGLDTLLSNDWIVGGALTYANTNVDLSDFRSGDSSKIKTYQLTGYATRDFGNWYLESMLAYAKQQYNGSRDTTVTGVANSDFNGEQISSRITAGYAIALNRALTLTPYAGVEYTYLKQDAYTETGAGALSLSVDGQSANRTRSVLGAKLGTELKASNGLIVSPSVHVAWRHEFNNSGIDSAATFTGGGAAFTTPGQDIARDTMNVGTMVSLQKSKDFSLALQADCETASGYRNLSAQVTGQWRF
jgi:outer membrane autotransporter protein